MRRVAWTAVCFFVGTLASVPLAAQEAKQPTQQPFLRIEPNMHTARITRIGVDKDCSVLATGAYDKTVRIWKVIPDNSPSGGRPPDIQLLKTVRVPIEPGRQGTIFAVALSASGKQLAIGGALNRKGDEWVYVLDVASGKVVRRITKLKGSVNHLAYSPDGRYLAVGLNGGAGMSVWDTATWRLVAADANYGGQPVYGLAFAPDGGLYTVSVDGYVRRYRAPYRQVAGKIRTRNKDAYSVAVQPRGGGRVAVGFASGGAVEVYRASDLSYLFSVDAKDTGKLALGAVAWSSDGLRLYAGGDDGVGGPTQIRVWSNAGRGSGRTEGPTFRAMHLLSCGDGIAYGAGDPAFGILMPNAGRSSWRTSVLADMRNKRAEHFTVSEDGQRVRLGLSNAGSEPVLFDLARLQLTDAPRPASDMFASDTKSLDVKGWEDTEAPTLDGKAITLGNHEQAHAVAIAPDAQSFVLGAEFTVRAFDHTGQVKWRQPAPAAARGVNIPRQGKLVAVAYDDGTVRWHRLSDGKELLALFVHATDRRWVAWTPTGYYMASPGAESLIGWHVNRSWDQLADFYPVSKFREQFYRPDIIARVLEDLDEDVSISKANQAANRNTEDTDISKRIPPVITIISPTDGTQVRGAEVLVEYSVRSPNKLPILDVRAFIDGRVISGQKGFVPISDGDNRFSLRVPVPPGTSRLSILAVSEAGESVPAEVRLTRPVPLAAPPTALFALVVGISEYARATMNLKYAHKDAEDFAEELSKQQGKAYQTIVIRKLTNKEATREAIVDGFQWLADQMKITANARGAVFFSGHGVTTPELVSYLLPQDVDTSRLIATGLSKKFIYEVLQGLHGRVLVFLDACHAGAGLESAGVEGARRLDTYGLVNQFGDAQNGIVSFVSSRGDQLSLEGDAWSNGAFTKALVEGLAGKALRREGDKEILTLDLERWLFTQVQEMTAGEQTPLAYSPPHIEPFVLALPR
jgi:WD40 repeat protein